MKNQIITQDESVVMTFAESLVSVERIVYRPAGRRHPEEWRAMVNGRCVTVTAASARMVIDLARNPNDYRYAGLTRHPWEVQMPDDGGRKWWGYKFTPNNDFGRYLVEVQQ
jgi:hypothetical protein